MSIQTSLHMTPKTKPEQALDLPKGRLKLGEFVVDFSPEQVLRAARLIVEYFDRAEKDEVEQVFVSQAGVIAYAAERFNIQPLEFDTEVF